MKKTVIERFNSKVVVTPICLQNAATALDDIDIDSIIQSVNK
jgi:hypothetical protein